MATALQRLLAAREQWIKVGSFELLIRRPTRYQLALWAPQEDAEGKQTAPAADARVQLRTCVIDWRGVTEVMVLPGGGPEPLAFDTDLFVTWIEDRPEELKQTFEAITAMIVAAAGRAEDLEKN